MKRSILAAAVCAGSLAACDVLLGLHDRTLEGEDAAADAADATACDGDFCACHPHDFCEDFDPYSQLPDLESRWQVPGFGTSIYQLGGSVALDNGNVVQPPSRPNALATAVLLQPPISQGAGFIMGQFPAPDAGGPVVGVAINLQMLVTHMDPLDGATPVLDSGVLLFGGVLALVNATSKNGVGITMSEQGVYVGYALNVLTAGARLAQGKQFFNLDPVFPSYVPMQLLVAKRSSKALPNVACTAGPVLTDVDGGSAPDASLPADPVVVVASTGFSPPACEVLSADLVDPGWLSSPIVVLGSIVTGQGVFAISFDNVTLDFLRE
ncbi:MAG TPA: hypothetical protein VLM85_10595 [Polyangiaceae bacterium]|nr:hypothetical protein [Polyangiaceae bacterium]